MKLYITRHGETEENKLGILQGHNPGRLTQEGIEQARALGKRLQTERFDQIYASDLGRVVATAAEITCFHKDTPVTFTVELRERDFGEFTGKNRHELQIESGFDVEPQQGESKVDFFARAKRILSELTTKHPEESVLLICHGGIGQAIIAALFQKSYEELQAMDRLGNTSLSIFDISPDGNYQVVEYNSTAHLR